jgi:hypothetical protein
MTRLSSTARGRTGRLTFGIMPVAAIVAVTLTACSSSDTGGTNTAKHHSAAPTATTAAASQPTSAAATSAGGLAGAWHGQYGGAYKGTFVLHWHQSGSHLGGRIHISDPASTLAIHGQVAAGAIKFGTVGSYRITYSGTVSGNSMSGSWQIQGAGQGGNWSATKG